MAATRLEATNTRRSFNQAARNITGGRAVGHQLNQDYTTRVRQRGLGHVNGAIVEVLISVFDHADILALSLIHTTEDSIPTCVFD